jgi:hypothetical protein
MPTVHWPSLGTVLNFSPAPRRSMSMKMLQDERPGKCMVAKPQSVTAQ